MARKPRKPQRGEYEVGRGRPPIATRWKPGQSGNPKGRRKGSKSMLTYLKDALDQNISIKERGRIRYAPFREVLAKALIARAAKGDFKALTYLFDIEPEITHQEPPQESEPRSLEELTKLYQKLVKQPH